MEKYIAKIAAVQDIDTLSQQNIDFIIENARKRSEDIYPKGIRGKTLQTIPDEMKKSSSGWIAGDELAEHTGLTGVTVRRYLNYLTEKGTLLAEIDYETGGRPRMRYKIT